MVSQNLEKFIDVDSIPTLPAIAMEAIRLMEGEDSGFESVADLLKNDQVLSTRILHYANSAHVGARNEITTISRAISQLGFNTIRTIILSVSVFDCFSTHPPENRTDFVNFWLHSIGVAASAEILAEKLGFNAPEEAYLAGLVHDVGKLVCFMHFPDKFAQVCQRMSELTGYSTKGPLGIDIENEIMDTNHAEVGKLVAGQWMFPEALGRAMWLHHQPVYETIKPEQQYLPQLIRFADVLCVSHNIGSSYFLLEANAYDPQHYHYALENLMLHHHLSPADIDEISKEVAVRVNEVGKVLGISDEETYRTLVSSANVSLGSMSLALERKNKQLALANQVLDATYQMTRRLKTGISIIDAVQEIILAAREAFGVARCLCMVLDPRKKQFVGQIFTVDGIEDLLVPVQYDDNQPNQGSSSNADIEFEAVRRLRQANIEFGQGNIMESGVADIIAGSGFMASFFVSEKKMHGRPRQIVGELMLDFQGTDRFERMEDLSRNFELLATAAANGVDRILLEKDLHYQARQLAEASRKMEESQSQLFHSHRLATVGRLAAGAAHEVNNPLTIISLNTQLMTRMLSGRDEPELKDRLQVINDQEERISKIIGELMGFARPSQPQLGEADIYEIMAQVLSVIGDRVSMETVRVNNNIPKNLVHVHVDSKQIEQVFMNLIINANHSMPEGGEITLQAEVDKNEREVWVSVIDNGTGISRGNLGKIFDPFFTTKKEGEGTGLGLAVCHSIVEHNGGVLKVKSVEGKGSTFFLSLPIDKGCRLRAMKQAVDQKKKRPEVDEVCRVLIVDDERLLNDMLQECLLASGYEVDGAYDGIEGIGLLRLKKFHLILLDIRMPRKDGLDVLKFVKEEYPDIPVIIITGLASLDEVKETVKMGAYACLKKPFVLEKVLEKVKTALNDSCKIPTSQFGKD